MPGIDNKIRQKGSSTPTTYYFSQDYLSSTTALTGTTGKLVERMTYDAYGNSAGSTRTRYGYTGRERDPLTSLLYYRARFYHPQLGRFTSEDPVGLKRGDINIYSYIGNNPISFSNPSGLWSPKAHREIILRAFKGCLSEAQMAELMDASDYMDGVVNGGAWMERYAHQHGMRAPDESIDHARRAASRFIGDEMRMAAQNRQAFDNQFPFLTGGITVSFVPFR